MLFRSGELQGIALPLHPGVDDDTRVLRQGGVHTSGHDNHRRPDPAEMGQKGQHLARRPAVADEEPHILAADHPQVPMGALRGVEKKGRGAQEGQGLKPPSATPASPAILTEIIAAAGRIVLGKETQIRLAIAYLLARGHLLIEDLPGVGKTTLAHTLVRLLGLQFSRIQFTSDMLPADIIGISIFDRERNDFRFIPGALFSQVLLADEINRATPKTQSALLEAMEERQGAWT